MTWGQPTYYINKILTNTFRKNSINISFICNNNNITNFDSCALIDSDKNIISLYFINWNINDININNIGWYSISENHIAGVHDFHQDNSSTRTLLSLTE